VARGEDARDGDIDILVALDPAMKIAFFSTRRCAMATTCWSAWTRTTPIGAPPD